MIDSSFFRVYNDPPSLPSANVSGSSRFKPCPAALTLFRVKCGARELIGGNALGTAAPGVKSLLIDNAVQRSC